MRTFYTIMEGENFLNVNYFKKNNNNINEAIKFQTIDDAREYFSDLNKEINFRIGKVNCEIEDIT